MGIFEARFMAMAELAIVRGNKADVEQEGKRNFNSWIAVLQLLTNRAWAINKKGDNSRDEYQAWLEIAQLALGRAEQLLKEGARDA